MTTIHILGTGTPTPTAARHGSAFAVQTGGDTILVDCGPGTTGKLVKAGLWPVDVSTVFLTHHHFDHNVDMPCFLLTRWDQAAGRGEQLHVLGPPPTSDFVEGIIGRNGLFAPDLEARTGYIGSLNVYQNRGGVLPREWPEVKTTDIKAGYVHRAESWTMRAFHAFHVQPYLDCVAYRLETSGGEVVAFSGDTGPCPSVVEAAQGADVFFCMAWDEDEAMIAAGENVGQTGVQGAARLAREAGAKHLVLVHTGPAISADGARERVTASAEQIFNGPVTFAEELTTIQI